MSLRTHDWPSRLEIDPTAYVAPGAIVVGEVKLARRASVWFNSVVRGDSDRIEIGEGTNIQDNSTVHVDEDCPALVGARVTVGHRAIVHGCVIEDDVLVGMGAVILSGAVVGRGSLIGASALVREGQVIPPGSLVLGMPAKVVGEVNDAHRAAIRTGAEHYADLADRYRARGVITALPAAPQHGEHWPRVAGRMSELEWAQILDVLATSPARVAEALERHGAAAFARRPAEGRWSAVEVLVHLHDCDAEIYRPRLARVLAEEFPAIAAQPAQDWVGERRAIDRDPVVALAEWRTQRGAALEELSALGPAAWSRPFVHSTRGAMTLADQVRQWADHDLSHRRQLFAALRGGA